MRAGRFSATTQSLSGFGSSGPLSQTLHNGISGGTCTCPFCSLGLLSSAGRSVATSKLSSTPRRPRTVSTGMQTVTEMNFDDWWNVDPLLETRAMVFRTYRQTKPYFSAWVAAVVQTGRSRGIMKKFLQQLRDDSVALIFSAWSSYLTDQKANKQKEDIVYKRFKFFSQLQCLKLWHQEAASQVSVRKKMKGIGFRIMNAGLNVCFLTWAWNAYMIARQRGILNRFVNLMTKGALIACFEEWGALTSDNIEKRKQESIMRAPPYWKPPRSQYTYEVTLRLMSHQPVCLTARLYGAFTSSDDLQSPPCGGQMQLDFVVGSFTHLGKLKQLMLWLSDGVQGKVYLDSADVIDVHRGVGYYFSFEKWIDSSGAKLSTAHCNSDGQLVRPPQDLPITVKHELRAKTREDLARKEAALRRFLSGTGSFPSEAFEIIHSAHSLDGLASDIFSKAFPHHLSCHHLQLSMLAAAMRRCVRVGWYSKALVARDTLVTYVASAVVRAINQKRLASNVFIWGMLQRAAMRAEYASMVAASSLICGYLRKKCVFWEIGRRWRATDILVRKIRQRQRWRAWRKFVAFMNQLRVLIQRLLPYGRLLQLKRAVAHIQCSMLRLRLHHEHVRNRHSILMLSYRIEGTALSALTRPVFLLWKLASKVIQSYLRRFLADYVRNIILMRVGTKFSKRPNDPEISQTTQTAAQQDQDLPSETGGQDAAKASAGEDGGPQIVGRSVAIDETPFVSVDIAAASPSTVIALRPPKDKHNEEAAAIAARLQAEYMRPTRYSSNIFSGADPRASVQKTIQILLRGSSSSVALSSRVGHSPFVDRVARVPHPPPTSKLSAGAAFAMRRLAPVGPASSDDALTVTVSVSAPAAGRTGRSASIGRLRSGDRGDSEINLLPPLPRKRS